MAERVDEELARDIVRYYLRNPQALDTLEGVVHWRLLEQRIHHAVREVQAALSWLIELGLLEESSLSGSKPLIGLNPGRLEEARRFVKEGPQLDRQEEE